MLCAECAKDPAKLISEFRRVEEIRHKNEMPWVHTVARVNRARWATEAENTVLRAALADIGRMKEHEHFVPAVRSFVREALEKADALAKRREEDLRFTTP